MSQFDEDGMSLAIEELVENLRGQRMARILWLDTEFRQLGYARYDKFESKCIRFWKMITRQEVMTREEWNETVDSIVEEAKARV